MTTALKAALALVAAGSVTAGVVGNNSALWIAVAGVFGAAGTALVSQSAVTQASWPIWSVSGEERR